MNAPVINKNFHDFEVAINDGLLKLVPCHEDAKKWIELNYLKPAGINMESDFTELRMQAYELERVLRRLMNQAYKVKFINFQA